MRLGGGRAEVPFTANAPTRRSKGQQEGLAGQTGSAGRCRQAPRVSLDLWIVDGAGGLPPGAPRPVGSALCDLTDRQTPAAGLLPSCERPWGVSVV